MDFANKISHGEGQTTEFVEKEHLRKMKARELHEGPWICERCGNWARQLESISIPDGNMKRIYDCGCGGKFWPGK